MIAPSSSSSFHAPARTSLRPLIASTASVRDSGRSGAQPEAVPASPPAHLPSLRFVGFLCLPLFGLRPELLRQFLRVDRAEADSAGFTRRHGVDSAAVLEAEVKRFGLWTQARLCSVRPCKRPCTATRTRRHRRLRRESRCCLGCVSRPFCPSSLASWASAMTTAFVVSETRLSI